MRRRLSLMDGFGLGFDSRHFHSTRFARSWQATSKQQAHKTPHKRCFVFKRVECPEQSRGTVYPERSRMGCYNLIMQFVYMIKNSYGDLYVGITDNPEKRLEYHNQK